jgi:hypothetical protein
MAFKAPSTEQDLTVRGESIESTYRSFRSARYWVNRRYQRKLIWTLEEKQGFIDSILRGYPVPIVLLAENASKDPSTLEIIDGMQRLNAIVSFIENEYAVNGHYFDLNTMAVTKELLDNNIIKQKSPILDRAECVKIASYSLPFSIYEFTEEGAVDEVFRRINSGGRKLSRQEIRTAGALGHFATAVRRIAAQVRGDDSHSDILRLNDMASVSITNRELDYGIPVEGIFWVNQSILTKEQVRESRDEEIIADLLAYMVLPQPPPSRTEFFDDYYGMREADASQKRYNEIELAVQKRTVDLVMDDFHKTFDQMRLILEGSGQSFGRLLFEQKPARAPRYFQVVFLAFYTLLVRENLAISNRDLLIARLTKSSDDIAVPEGGRWGGEDRHTTVQAAAGTYREAFESVKADDPAKIHWITRIENLLSQSLTEQSLYDFKQGFVKLDGTNAFDEDNFEKILKICAAIANNRQGSRGYVLVGVSDKSETTNKVVELFGVEPNNFLGISVVGCDHGAAFGGKSSDQIFQWVTDKVSGSKLSSPLREYVARHLKPVRYFDKTVYVFESEGQQDPSSYDGNFYDRRGAQLKRIEASDLGPFMRRYIMGG